MAKYTITHACGHTTTQQIYGTNSHGERDRKIKWWESVDCPQCYGRQKRAEAENKHNVEIDIINDYAKIGLVRGAKLTAGGHTVTVSKLTADKVYYDNADNKTYCVRAQKIADRIKDGICIVL